MTIYYDLTDRFPMKFDLERMRAEYRSLEGVNWLGHYDDTLSRDWKAILLVSLDGRTEDEESQRGSDDISRMRRTHFVERLPYFGEILDSFECPQGRVRILKLEPGAGIGLHRDIRHEVANLAFRKVRLHIPILTNDKVTFFVGNRNITMNPGRLYYVNFSKKHFVRNDGDTVRIHLVLDLVVNDWLLRFFPELSMFEKISHFIVRWSLPVYWRYLSIQTSLIQSFWRRYNGSILQSLKYRIMSKRY